MHGGGLSWRKTNYRLGPCKDRVQFWLSTCARACAKGVCVPPVACRPAEHLPRREREIVKARSGERRPRVSDVAALSGNGLFARGTPGHSSFHQEERGLGRAGKAGSCRSLSCLDGSTAPPCLRPSGHFRGHSRGAWWLLLVARGMFPRPRPRPVLARYGGAFSGAFPGRCSGPSLGACSGRRMGNESGKGGQGWARVDTGVERSCAQNAADRASASRPSCVLVWRTAYFLAWRAGSIRRCSRVRARWWSLLAPPPWPVQGPGPVVGFPRSRARANMAAVSIQGAAPRQVPRGREMPEKRNGSRL